MNLQKKAIIEMQIRFIETVLTGTTRHEDVEFFSVKLFELNRNLISYTK